MVFDVEGQRHHDWPTPNRGGEHTKGTVQADVREAMSEEEDTIESLKLGPDDTMLMEIHREEWEALKFADSLLEAVDKFKWSAAFALHVLSKSGFANTHFGIYGSGAFMPSHAVLDNACGFDDRRTEAKYGLDPLNREDPYSTLWAAVSRMLEACVYRGGIRDEWRIRFLLHPQCFGSWMEVCRDAFVEQLEKAAEFDGDGKGSRKLGMWVVTKHSYDVDLVFEILRAKPALFFRAGR